MKTLKFIWGGLGKPQMWVLVMFLLFVSELTYGYTLFGGFWIAVCLIAYYLSRIAVAIESLKT